MTNCYVLAEPDRPAACWVVDPGLSPGPLLDYLRRNGLAAQRILLTHCHADHIAGVRAVKQAFPHAVLTAPSRELGFLSDPVRNMSLPFGFPITAPEADQIVAPGEELALGSLVWRSLDTAGHTPGGLSYYCAAAGAVLTGDALFAGSIGRTNIPGACESKLLKNIRDNLLTLPDATRVLPGHGPVTSIGQERLTNPFLQ
ncbi:MAG: hypothetical protein AMJ81_14105 [Phycisphaerae bacterium SM23_33]|nr:MAG: hypothetical protein AMJ81_14105 [Phycisphaerae bacterium SM23_33]